MRTRYKFNRMELAGSLGDLGTLLPLAIGMILVNGLSPLSIFFTIGMFYILSGAYYGVTVPVQPMKVIGAYAIATGMSAIQISAAGLLMGGRVPCLRLVRDHISRCFRRNAFSSLKCSRPSGSFHNTR